MSQVNESIEVDVPVRTAYTQWTRFETFPLFMDGV
ncbi:cyclase, partial [Streptomyces goshikiensis]